MLSIAALAIVSSVAWAGSTTPEQIHIALSGKDNNGNSNGIAVSWQTSENTGSSTVKFGLASNQYSDSAVGSSASYYETFNHHVVLEDLEPDTWYYYVVGDNQGGFSKEYKFRTAPLSSSTRSFKFGVFADLGTSHGESTLNYLSNTMKDDVSLVWHGGDVSYADDSFLHPGCLFKFCYESSYNEYMNDIEGWASMIPYMVAPGNHEAECHDPACLASKDKREKLSNFTAYNGRFHMPSEETGGVLNMWYSFNYGNAHFISIDTETGYPGAAEETRYVLPCGGFGNQLQWLEADLIAANADRANRPWVFVQGHHPMYQGASVNADFQTAMEELFYKYNVDIYFSGHVHSYERDYPTYRSVVDANGYNNPRATTYLMIGGAGNDEMKNVEKDSVWQKAYEMGRKYDKSPKEDGSNGRWAKGEEGAAGPWTAKVDTEFFGIGRVSIVDDNKLTFDYIHTTTGEVFDSITLVRDHSALH
jgi:hypothetical protein